MVFIANLNHWVYPVSFAAGASSPGAAAYLEDTAVQRMAAFFEAKGLATLKEEDRAELWYDDWIAYQAKHGLYASVLSPKAYSTCGRELDLLKLTRFWEAAAFFGPAHAYSLHVSFLGIFPILRSDNEALKREAVAALEAGALFAFAVSEQGHGADLLGTEFTVTQTSPERYVARGSKYYIGNANAATIVTVLAKRSRRGDADDAHAAAASRRVPLMFFALRPSQPGAIRSMRKIRTTGVRSAYVAAFEVDGHEFSASDVICQGREAWEALFATVNLGKFFLGFASIGACEHAFAETLAHTRGRILYGKPVFEMPHIRATMAHAYARLAGMKLFAYRAVDYLHSAGPEDRRYLLFAAVQKARVGTEGVKVVALLSECMGAKGFEADTYFESALRDVPLIPTLEGSTHINHEVAAQFVRAYFEDAENGAKVPSAPPSLATLGAGAGESPYLFSAVSGDVGRVSFADCLTAYPALAHVRNVSIFDRQVSAFRAFVRASAPVMDPKQDSERVIALGKCLSIVAFAQLIAEHCQLAHTPAELVSLLFHEAIEDFSFETAKLAALPRTDPAARGLLAAVSAVPETSQREIDGVAGLLADPN